jgi:hypothetical protein
VHFKEAFRKVSLGSVASVHCAAVNYDQISAIRHRILVQGFQSGLAWSQTVKAQGTIHGSQRTESNY